MLEDLRLTEDYQAIRLFNYKTDDFSKSLMQCRNSFIVIDNADNSILNDKEKSILDKVIVKFKDYKAKKIIDYMHNEKAYIETKPGEIIPFSLAKEIKEF